MEYKIVNNSSIGGNTFETSKNSGQRIGLARVNSINLYNGLTITSIDVTATAYDLKQRDIINIGGQELTLNSDEAAGSTTLSIVSIALSFDIELHDLIDIDYKNLFIQYQRKTEGTVAGFDIDADGISKGGIEITGWLNSDIMTDATINNVPTALSVKNYVESVLPSSSNYAMGKCTGTVTTSATDGEVNAVVIPFDTKVFNSTSDTITFHGSAGVSGITDSAYVFDLGPNTDLSDYELNWNVGTDTLIVNNRITGGVNLQAGTVSGSAIVWDILTPTNSYIYNRGTGAQRLASTSNSIFTNHGGLGKTRYFRLMIWKVASANASTTLISVINSTQITIKKL
tara:strand:+ start:762 stop:1787 length:1026 start_codon:yes stop_codon:yes gene_type:complete